MAEMIEKRFVCDYKTDKLTCQKWKDVKLIEVRVNSDGPAIYYSADLCPLHAAMLFRGITKVMGLCEDQADPADVPE